MAEPGQLSVIVPVFNENEGLERLLAGLYGYSQERGHMLILVNDGSTDGSGEIVQQYASLDTVTVIHHKLNKGYGAALKSGFTACTTEFAITFDADGQHSVHDIGRLFDVIREKDADLVIGSRRGNKPSSYYRGIGKGFIRYLAKVLMTVPVYDLNSGMKIYRTEPARKYLPMLPDTMAFSDIITLVFINNRDLVIEEPITVKPRTHGKSAISLQTAFQTVMEVIHIVILFNPMKIFLPLSMMCLLITAIWGIPLVIAGRGVSMGTLLGIVTGLLLFLLGLIAEQLSLIRRNQVR